MLPLLRWYHSRLRFSVTVPSWTRRLPDRSSGSISPRFSRQTQSRAASSWPIMIRASEPPTKVRRFSVDFNIANIPFIKNINDYNRQLDIFFRQSRPNGLVGLTLLVPAQCRAARGLLDWTQHDLA